MLLFPNCKVNIGLQVLRKRDDGYHDISTVMVPVPRLSDVLEVTRSGTDGLEFVQTGLAVDCPEENNLCVKAYRLMAGDYGIGGARIHLHKVVPFGAGLGAGSADAAFTIRALDSIFGLGLPVGDMEGLASELGSDTAFFIRNSPALSEGRGEILIPVELPALDGKLLAVVKPPFGVSTAEAYSAVIPLDGRPPLRQLFAEDIVRWKETVANDFEKSVFALYPELEKIKNSLYRLGALYCSLSGSGSAVYGIFPGHCATDTSAGLSGGLHELLSREYPDCFIHTGIL